MANRRSPRLPSIVLLLAAAMVLLLARQATALDETAPTAVTGKAVKKSPPPASQGAALSGYRLLKNAIVTANTYSLSKKPYTFVLKTNVYLKGTLPGLIAGATLNIKGQCTSKTGKPRKCIIDGSGKYSVFFSFPVTAPEKCHLDVDNIIFRNVRGSVFSSLECSLRVANSVFIDNTSPHGGAVLMGSGKPGGYPAVIFTYCQFINNRVLSKAFGGGAVIDTGHAKFGLGKIFIYNSKFVNNTSIYKASFGGAISVSGFGQLFLRSVHFDGNAAGIAGGAIYASGTDVTVISSHFHDNKALRGAGGAIFFEATYFTPNPVLKLCSSMFEGNSARLDHRFGSDLYLGTTSTTSFGKSSFYAGTLEACKTPLSDFDAKVFKGWTIKTTCTGSCA